ncbi:MAG: methyltransferase domain-containing protein [Chloroflexaceae bacterium]|nr:methyltransferase domain-containing protein [Chloroflexaceae bacterium]
MLKSWLEHPLTRGLSIDDPQVTDLRQRILQEKRFLRDIYTEWYQAIIAALPPCPGAVLELGSGAGFLRQFLPNVITSEIFVCCGIDAVLDAQQLPLADNSLAAIVMTDVLHHMGQPRRFLHEAGRCLRPGGRVVMIEPWVSRWSTLMYTALHHEPFRPQSATWEFPTSGPLSGANGAMPWMIFVRDRSQFLHAFPDWHIVTIQPMLPFRYLLSGGVSMRSLMPSATSGLWRRLEAAMHPWIDHWAMFALIVLEYSV